MTQDQIKHLEFIQAIITRMNANSFKLKGWAVVIISALLALFASSSNVVYFFVAIIPTLLFWCLDAYYLQQERKFRGVYDDVIADNGKVKLFEMPIQKYKGKEYCFCKVLWSKTILAFYGIIVVLLLLGGLILK
jgi:hypothetical protein